MHNFEQILGSEGAGPWDLFVKINCSILGSIVGVRIVCEYPSYASHYGNHSERS